MRVSHTVGHSLTCLPGQRVIAQGSMNGGHYVSYVKRLDRESHARTSWVHCSDSHISPVCHPPLQLWAVKAFVLSLMEGRLSIEKMAACHWLNWRTAVLLDYNCPTSAPSPHLAESLLVFPGHVFDICHLAPMADQGRL